MEKRGPFQVKGSREVYRNQWISVREDVVVRPGGADGTFGVVEMVPGSSVLALDDSGNVKLVKEFKYAVGRETLEVVSGAIDGEETPLAAAQRELLEETGFRATEWVDLGVVDPFTTVVSCPNYLYLARGLQRVSQPEPEELVELVSVSLEEAVAMVERSEITHGASCTLILKAYRFINRI
jgi:ADP-ribose pyrophosphatase